MNYIFLFLFSLVLSLPIFSFSLDQSNWSLNGFSQIQYLNDETSDSPQAFSLARVRFGVNGKIEENIYSAITLGTVEQSDRDPHLVNGFIDLTHFKHITIRIGQFLVPFGLEGPTPIIKSHTIERSTVVQSLNPFILFRDKGIQASGGYKKLTYAIALMNGTGANNEEDNDEKDLLAHISFTPMNSLQVGLSGHNGYYQDEESTLSRTRLGFDITHHINWHTFIAEYISKTDNKQTAMGWYILENIDISETWSVVSRFESYIPNTISSDSTSIFTIGLNYKLENHNRLSVNYEMKDGVSDSNSANKFTAQLQIVF